MAEQDQASDVEQATTRVYNNLSEGVHRATLTQGKGVVLISWAPEGEDAPTAVKYASLKAAEADGWAESYDVRSRQTGAGVILSVPLEVAQSEARRLNVEARRPGPFGAYAGMQAGEVTVYEVVAQSGLVVA